MRSLELDTKEWSDELLKLMEGLGNAAVNGAWEGALPAGRKPPPNAAPAAREEFVRAKYEKRAFVAPSTAAAAAAAASAMAAAAASAAAAAAAAADGAETEAPEVARARGVGTGPHTRGAPRVRLGTGRAGLGRAAPPAG